MRKFTLALLAGAALVTAGAPAIAQAQWQSINQRQARLDQRIDQGVRNGALSQAEAVSLRGEFRDIVRLEDRYRANGLTQAERNDLDQRLDRLQQRIRIERRDDDGRNWWDINARQAELDRRIDEGVRRRQLTRAEAVRLRAEFRGIAQLENRYRKSGRGLDATERADLNRRFAILATKIRWERSDWENRRR